MNFDVNFHMDGALDAEMGEFTRGPKGADGVTPHIGENGNWYLGEEDTGVKAQGPAGDGSKDSVLYTAQELTEEQQIQARKNIEACVRLFYGSDEVITEGVALDDGYGFKDVVVFPRTLNEENIAEGQGEYKFIKNSTSARFTLTETTDGTGLEASTVIFDNNVRGTATIVSCTELFPGCWKTTIQVSAGRDTYNREYILGSQLSADYRYVAGLPYISHKLLPGSMAYAGWGGTNDIPSNASALKMTNHRMGYVDSEITIVRSDSELRDAMVNESRVVALNYSDKKADLLFTNSTYQPSGSYRMTSGIAIKDGKIGTFSITTNSSMASFLSVSVDIPEDDAAPLIVTITGTTTGSNTTYSADHTFEEIMAAIEAGQNVFVMYSGQKCQLKWFAGNEVAFGYTEKLFNAVSLDIYIPSTNIVEVTETTINELPEPTEENAGKYLKVVGSENEGYSWSAEDAPGGSSGDSDISLGLTSATVGQIAKISAVDANGKPTAWGTIDGYTGQVTAEKLTNPDHATDLVQYAAFQAAVPMVQQMNITGATVGQIIKVKAVDSSGHPTQWEAVDMPSGGGEAIELLGTLDASTADVLQLEFEADMKEIYIYTNLVDSAGEQYKESTTAYRTVDFKQNGAWKRLSNLKLGCCSHGWGWRNSMSVRVVAENRSIGILGSTLTGYAFGSTKTLGGSNATSAEYIGGNISGVQFTLVLPTNTENTASGTIEVYGVRA